MSGRLCVVLLLALATAFAAPTASAKIFLQTDLCARGWKSVDEINPNKLFRHFDEDLRKTSGSPVFQLQINSKSWARGNIRIAEEGIALLRKHREAYGSDWRKKLKCRERAKSNLHAIAGGSSFAILLNASAMTVRDFSACRQHYRAKTEPGECFRDWSSAKVWLKRVLRSKGFVASSSRSAPRSERKAERPPAKRPEVSEGVRKMQKVLAKCGFKPGPADGLWGKRTARAAAAYIKAHGGTPGSEQAQLMAQVDGNRTGDAGPCPSNKVADKAAEEEKTPEKEVTADYAGKDLSGKNLTGQELKGANFSNANVSSVMALRAKLAHAKFINADASNANFSNSDMTRVNMKNAKVERTNFSGSRLIGAIFDKAKAKFANFTDTDLERASFRGANVIGATFDRAKMRGVDFRDIVVDRVVNFADALAEGRLAGARMGIGLASRVAQAYAVKEFTQGIQDKSMKDFEKGFKKVVDGISEKIKFIRKSDGSVLFPIKLQK